MRRSCLPVILLMFSLVFASANAQPTALPIDQIIWSPDSTTVAIMSMGNSPEQTGEVYLYNANDLSTGAQFAIGEVGKTVFGRNDLAASLSAGELTADTIVIWSYEEPDSSEFRFIEGYEGNPDPYIKGCHATDFVPSDLSLHPNGRLVATSRNDGSLVAFNIETGRFVSSYNGSLCTPRSLDYNPDGSLIASTHLNGDVQMFSTIDGALLWKRTIKAERVMGITFSPRGDFIAFGIYIEGSVGTVSMRDLAGNAVREFPLSVPAFEVGMFEFNPDGELLAVAGDDGIITIYAVDTGEIVAELEGADGLNRIAFSPDGSLLAYGGDDGILRLWDMMMGGTIETVSAPTFTIIPVTPTSTPTRTPLPTQTLTATPLLPTVTASRTAVPSLTSTRTPSQTATATATRTPT